MNHTGGTSALDLTVAVTFFADAFASHKTQAETTLRAIVPKIRDTTRETKAKLPWLKLASFGELRSPKNSLRHDDNVVEIHGVEADYDDGKITIEQARQILATAGIAAILYTSPGHTVDKPRWRVLCPTSHPYAPSERARFLARVNGLFVGALSGESFTLSQSYYYGKITESTAHEVLTIDGIAIDLAEGLDAQAVGKPEKPKAAPRPTTEQSAAALGRPTGCSNYGMAVLEDEANRVRNASDGEKHRALCRAGYAVGGLVPAHLIQSIAYSALTDALEDIRHKCVDYAAAQKTLAECFDAGMGAPRAVPDRGYVRRDAPPPAPRYADTPDENGEFVRLEDDDQPPPIDDPGYWEAIDAEAPPKADKAEPAPNTSTNRLPVVYFDDIQPSNDVADFVEGLIIEGSAGVLYGDSNSGKTFLMTDLALHVASGRKWRGREIDQGAVIYVALEGGIGFRNRIEAWRREFADDIRVTFASIMMPINLLDAEADTERLIEAIHEVAETLALPVKLVVIDTLSRAMAGGNENAPDDMGSLVMNMDRIRSATKTAVFFVHHSGKDAAKGARGHSLLRAAIDTEIEVTTADDSPNSHRMATVVKQRELPKGDVFGFTLKVVQIGVNKRGKPVTSCVVEGSDEGHTAGAVPSSRLKGHPRRALEVLHDLLAESGKGGFRGTPPDAVSVPAEWWRDRFYERAMPGDAQEAKKKAFQRASSKLIEDHVVAMGGTRVWLPRYEGRSHNNEGNQQDDV